jgi:hypothetical protein
MFVFSIGSRLRSSYSKWIDFNEGHRFQGRYIQSQHPHTDGPYAINRIDFTEKQAETPTACNAETHFTEAVNENITNMSRAKR